MKSKSFLVKLDCNKIPLDDDEVLISSRMFMKDLQEYCDKYGKIKVINGRRVYIHKEKNVLIKYRCNPDYTYRVTLKKLEQ